MIAEIIFTFLFGGVMLTIGLFSKALLEKKRRLDNEAFCLCEKKEYWRVVPSPPQYVHIECANCSDSIFLRNNSYFEGRAEDASFYNRH